MPRAPSDEHYQELLRLRDQIRRFIRWSEQQALDAGVTPAQHQLLLAIRGHRGGPPTIGDVAEHLLLRHHSVVALVDRAADSGLVRRERDAHDHRVVRLVLTRRGSRLLESLATQHLEELSRIAAMVEDIASGLRAASSGRLRPPRS